MKRRVRIRKRQSRKHRNPRPPKLDEKELQKMVDQLPFFLNPIKMLRLAADIYMAGYESGKARNDESDS